MSTKTTNFEFIKPELTDNADITQYNSNWDKVDTKFKTLDDMLENGDFDAGLGYVKLTLAEYNSLADKDEETLYIITDSLGEAAVAIKNVTVSTSKWIDETDTTALFRYRISNASILENMAVDVLFKVTDYTEEQASSLVRATNGGVLNATTANAGYVDIYSTSAIDTDLVCDLVLTQLKVV